MSAICTQAGAGVNPRLKKGETDRNIITLPSLLMSCQDPGGLDCNVEGYSPHFVDLCTVVIFLFSLQIISDDMLYLMILEPGNDMGNVVAWRDFARPSSIPEEAFYIEKTNANFRVNISKCTKTNRRTSNFTCSLHFSVKQKNCGNWPKLV